MHVAEWLLAVFIGLFALRGLWLGLPATLCRLTALVAGYLAAITLTPAVAVRVEQHTPLAGLTPYPVTAVGLFLLTVVLLRSLGGLLIRFSLTPQQQQGGRWLAAAVNGSVGLLLGLVAIWLTGLVQGAMHPQQPPQPSALQAQADRLVARSLLALLPAQPPGNAVEPLLAQPAQSMADLQYLARHNALQAWLQAPETLGLLRQGDPRGLQRQPAFRQLMQDERLTGILRRTALLPARTDTVDATALAEGLIRIWAQAEAGHQQPRVQAILNERDYRQALQNRELLRLANDPRTAELSRLLIQARPGPLPSSGMPPAEVLPLMPPESERDREPTIYRWQDTRGIWHFSDRQP